MVGQDSDESKNKKKKSKKKEAKVKTREQALQALSVLNKRLFKESSEFDLSKLLELIDEMLRMR